MLKVGQLVYVATDVVMPNRSGDGRYQWRYGVVRSLGVLHSGKIAARVEYGIVRGKKKNEKWFNPHEIKAIQDHHKNTREYKETMEILNLS